MADENEAGVRVTPNGPYRVKGITELVFESIGTNEENESVRYVESKRETIEPPVSLCRCGHSSNKPFCDGSHKKVGFDGTETASKTAFADAAKAIAGPELTLQDARPLCAGARFCDPNGGVWDLVRKTDDEDKRRLFLEQTHRCPSGRLVAVGKELAAPIEPSLAVGISLIDDPSMGVIGPIWLKGGVPLTAADGTAYQTRNRMALCRCGKSGNKPFCDGSHLPRE